MSTQPGTELRALAAVDPEQIVALLVELMAVPSVNGSDAECEIQHLLAKRMERLGLDVDLWSMDLAQVQGAPGFPGVEVPREEAWGLVGITPGGDGPPGLILQGHVDVVPSGDRTKWSQDPFEPLVTARRVYGRGACDMKAGVVANLAALDAIRDAGINLSRPVALHCVVGEEDGGLGAFATLERGHGGNACIITEPTSAALVTGNAGALTFSIDVPGKATHGSTRYAGSSAIDSYLEIHRGLHDLEGLRNQDVEPLMGEYPIPYPISIGRLQAGDWASSVPDRLVAEGRMGVRITEEPASARRELEEAVRQVSERDPFLRDHPAVVRWTGGQFRGGHLPAGEPLRELVGRAHADTTGTAPPPERGAPYGSDLRLYQAGGIPTLHYGPGDARFAHGPQEHVDVAEIVQVARTLVLAILRSCGQLV